MEEREAIVVRARVKAVLLGAVAESGLSEAEIARRAGRPRSFIWRVLHTDCNVTVNTIAAVLDAAGYRLKVNAVKDPI